MQLFQTKVETSLNNTYAACYQQLWQAQQVYYHRHGYVSNYFYDAAGQRTVKEHGGSEGVYVNSEFSGGTTDTGTFTLYASPFLTWTQGGLYVKHVFAGGQRIVSKLGDYGSYGADPRRIQKAGASAHVSIDYDGKYAALQQVVRNNYEAFGVPYNGTDNDDYVNGESFCCTPSPSASGWQATASANGAGDWDEDTSYEQYQYYYHPDHLGSSSYITDLTGAVVQHVEYIPYGEVFVEEQNSNWNTPYKFNGKELDEETGMYYYGARYYDPRLSIWHGTDLMQGKYPGVSTYTYCDNNPIRFVDLDGREKLNGLNKNKDKSSILDYQAFDDAPNIINVWGHGNGSSIDLNGVEVSDAPSFAKYLYKNSKVWNNRKNDELIIVLHSCYNAGFAEELSKSPLFENVLIIGPTDNVSVETIRNTDGGDLRLLRSYVANSGRWIGYKNGEYEYSWESFDKPGAKDPYEYSNWKKYYETVMDKYSIKNIMENVKNFVPNERN